MIKHLIRCPECERQGIRKNLAQVLRNGLISIQRLKHKIPTREHTIVGGTNFFVVCGNCGHKVYIRRKKWRKP